MKKSKIICIVVVFLFTMNLIPLVGKADTITIPYKDDNGTKCINIVDLANAMKSEIKRVDGKITITIDGKSISFKENDSFIAIDGQVVALKTETKEVKGSKESFKLPIPQKISKDGDGYLIPIDILEKYMGIKGTENGVIIEGETTKNRSNATNTTTNNRKNRPIKNNGTNSNNDDGDVVEKEQNPNPDPDPDQNPDPDPDPDQGQNPDQNPNPNPDPNPETPPDQVEGEQ